MNNEIDIHSDRVKELGREVQLLAAEIHTIFQPQWNARADVLKTIVSLCSGSIVLSVAFSSSIRLATPDPIWRRLVLVSFVLLVVALVCAFVALWVGATVHEIQSSVLAIRNQITKVFTESSSREDFGQTMKQIAYDTIHPIEKADTWTARLFKASCVAFCVALLILAAVGIRQLSS